MRMFISFMTPIAAAAWATLGGAVAMAQVKAPAPPENPAANLQAVPIKEVVLYTSGVGYFEHFGTVKDNGYTELHFKTRQINDILKSLVLEDLDKGKVAAVTYGSQEPIEHELKSFQVDLSSAPSLSALLAQLRGASVTAQLSDGAVSGVVLSVEKKPKPVGDKQVIQANVLNLLLPKGTIRQIDLDAVVEVRFDDAKLQQELVKALSAVAASRDQDSKAVAIQFNGQGERHVRIGYVVEAPVWKTSYRLVLTEDAKNENPAEKALQNLEKAVPDAKGGKLQGWAIIENQTDSDWENVQLSLVSGRPISFVENLYEPLFVTRPTVEPELYASLRPQRYGEGMNAAPVDALRAKRGMEEEKQTQFGARRKAMAYAAAPANAPMGLAMDAAAADKDASHAVQQQERLDATASVSALASGASVGEFFQYTVGDVSLSRQKSAMIPIITDTVLTTRMSIYNAAVLADHPLLGARLTNTTGKLLPQGPITVLDGGAYAGDATIEDLPDHQSRLLSYGIDQSMLVHNNDQTQDSSLVTGKIVKGMLELTYKQTFSQSYVAQNKGTADRTLLIEHPRRIGWKLTAPLTARETTDALYRFEETVPAAQTQKLTVSEELVSAQEIAILSIDETQVEAYAKESAIPDSVKKALLQAGKLKAAVADIERQIQERQQSLTEITQEQDRIRQNLRTVSASSDYYKRLEKELDVQETQIEGLKNDVKDLRQKLEKTRGEFEQYVQNLSVG